MNSPLGYMLTLKSTPIADFASELVDLILQLMRCKIRSVDFADLLWIWVQFYVYMNPLKCVQKLSSAKLNDISIICTRISSSKYTESTGITLVTKK